MTEKNFKKFLSRVKAVAVLEGGLRQPTVTPPVIEAELKNRFGLLCLIEAEFSQHRGCHESACFLFRSYPEYMKGLRGDD